MPIIRRLLTQAAFLCVLAPHLAAADLADQFRDPPQEARPRVYWTWLHTTLSKKRITFELEEMKKKGIAGALLWESSTGFSRYGTRMEPVPAGSRWMGPEWREHARFAFQEAERLGIEVSLALTTGANCGGPWISPADSAQKLVWSVANVTGPARFSELLPLPEKLPLGEDGKPLYYRDIGVFAAEPFRLGQMGYKVEGSQLYPIEDLSNVPIGNPWIDVTKHMDASGRLTWDVPAGVFRIVRLGHSTTGQRASHMHPDEGGFYADHMRADSIELNTRTMLKELFGEGPLPRSLKYLHCDSYEVYNSDWTPNLVDEFRKRRGYDPARFLPTLESGGSIETRAITARFREDLDKTRSDCFADYHYGKLLDLAHERGMGFHSESAGTRIFQVDPLKALGRNDIPMGEFWMEEDTHRVTPEERFYVRCASNAAHIYGKRFAAAESFTSIGRHWEEDPWSLKPVGDMAFLEGVNRIFLHTFSHSPDELGKPGAEYFAGTHINPNVTWWDQSRAWLDYLSRCQLLLSQGLFVADVLRYYGDQVPNFVPRRHVDPSLGPGYDYDLTNAEVILTRMSVRDGRIVLPDGMSYRLLVLPDRKAMPPDVLRKIGELVKAGATVVGPAPSEASGLQGYPESDREVQSLANEIWGNVNGKTVTERRYGKGRVIVGRNLRQILAGAGIAPDFEMVRSLPGARVEAIHRATQDADIYFVVNESNRWEEVECAFRVSGKAPELWIPDTGDRKPQSVYATKAGRTVLPLRLAPYGSVFVVFRGTAAEHAVKLTRGTTTLFPASPHAAGAAAGAEVVDASAGSVTLRAWSAGRYVASGTRGRVASFQVAAPPAPLDIAGPWTVRFTPGWGAPESVVFDRLISWTERPEDGIRYYSGTAAYETTFNVPAGLISADTRLELDLGELTNLAEVRLNGTDLGTLWKPPFRSADIAPLLRPQGNRLEVRVTNLWVNRMIGDELLPRERRYTHANMYKFTAQSPLRKSGLFGPVRIVAAREMKAAWRAGATPASR